MSSRRCPILRQSGVTLLDMILAIVVIGISVAAVVSTFRVAVQHSVDPMTRQQAQLIAEAYLEEILLQNFYDPDTDNVCPAAEAGGRSAYDNVCDYNGLNEAPKNQFGAAVAALAAYNVQVSVVSSNAPATLVLNTLDNSSVTKVLRVDVRVTGPNSADITLSGYRANYNCNALGDAGCK
jgi:MSHA pilin protein MshD